MKRCGTCQAEIVLEAAHCPHCGAKQDAKTVMGFQGGPNAADVRAALAAAQKPAPAPAPAPRQDIGTAATLYETSMPGISLSGGDEEYASANIGPAGPPAHAPEASLPGFVPATFAPPDEPESLNLQLAGEPDLAAAPAWTAAAASQPAMAAPWPRTRMATSPAAAPGGTAVAHEVGAGGLRGVSIVFGLLLLASTLGPQAFPEDGSVTWGYRLLESIGDGGHATTHGALAIAGALAFLFGALPVPNVLRAIAATLAGLGPIIASIVVEGRFLPEGRNDAEINALLALAGYIVLPTGFIMRARHWPSTAARVVATLGTMLFVAVVTIPIRDDMPILSAVDMISTSRMLPVAITIFAVLLLGLSGLLTWLPQRMGAGAGWLAWVALAAPPAAVAAMIIKEAESVERVARLPAASVYPIVWLLALGALGAYGLAGLLGRFDAWRA